jgi:hypothetical protein
MFCISRMERFMVSAALVMVWRSLSLQPKCSLARQATKAVCTEWVTA